MNIGGSRIFLSVCVAGGGGGGVQPLMANVLSPVGPERGLQP